MSFVHLHCHSEYSLLDGFSNIKKMVKRAKELGMPALALTDHGAMHGVIEFFTQATEQGVKPIIGLEAYMAPRGMRDKDAKLDKKSFHLLLLAENQTGYQNLLQIASAAQLEGFYYYPRIDRDFLAAHSAGLICTSGCMSAEAPRAIQEGNLDEARRRLDWYYEVFGRDRFFFELQHHNIPELHALNKTLLELGTRYQAQYLATNDVHYINPTDARLQDVLLAIQTGCLLSDPTRMRMTDQSYYLRPPEEMAALFADVPGALSNTLLVAERCAVDLQSKGYHLPQFPVPPGHTDQTYLRQLCEDGLRQRYGTRATDARVRERLDYEFGVIQTMGFAAYFLIVWDLCRQARETGIWYTARGSAAGSIVAYALGITLVEPIEHGLIFERFLNPGRISMPDIDLDFQDDLRAKMLDYCVNKYGSDKVAQIITFGTMGARAAIRDVGRVMDIKLPVVDRIAKTIPNIPGKPVTVAEALETATELKQLYEKGVAGKGEDDSLPAAATRELIDTAAQMEGVVRSVGTHAAGVVIADKPVIEYLPLHRATNNADATPIKTVTQFEMGILETLGMLKVDFLGLITLTIMQRACDLIRARHGVDLNLSNIPLDDPATFELMGRGQTAGVFQLEGSGMTRYLVEMKPKNLANVVAMIALYRPGPLDFIPSYIRRMHGQESVDYRHPSMEPIFKETFGIPVYQEQIMRAAVELAGYSMPESDELRKAIAKKQKDKLEKHREKFIKGAVKHQLPQATAEQIFADWEEFARYGFNKCLTGETEVVDVTTGRLVRIEDIYQGKARLRRTLTCDEKTLTLKVGRVAEVMDNGVKPVYRLTTALGHEIQATGNHPFYTPEGWRWLAELKAGDHIAVPRRLPVEGQQEWPQHRVIALGHLLAEGNVCHPHSVYFYSQDRMQVDDFVRAAEAFENVACSLSFHKSTFSVYAKRIDRAQPPGIMQWVQELGLWGKTAREKEIPAEVFELTNRQVGLLISRMWEGDGHIGVKGRSLFYATASERMARQLQHLFLRLGIISRLRRVTFPYKDGRTGYQLFVTGNDNLTAFANQVAVHFVSAQRRAALRGLCLKPSVKVGTKDVVPLAVKELVRAAKDRAGITWLEMRAVSGLAPREFYPTSTATKNGFTRQAVARLADYFGDPALHRMAANDVYWDEVVEVEYVGKKRTYDLEVPGTHNFIANDIVVHNSHAAVYGVISVQTAYLKAHYPAEYMTALLSANRSKADDVALYIQDSRGMGIEVLPPDVNTSGLDFTIETVSGAKDSKSKIQDSKPAIRFGMAAVKNVGEGPVQAILQARKAGGPFRSLDDFCQRVDLRLVGKRALECLVKVGALNLFGPRPQLLEGVDAMVNASAAHFRAQEAGQLMLFGGGGGGGFTGVALPKIKTDVPRREQLKWEKELMGLYVSDHPLQTVMGDLQNVINAYSSQLTEDDNERQVTMAGVVTNLRTHQTKKGDLMGFVSVEDLQGHLELVLFPRLWKDVSKWLALEQIVVIRGKVDAKGGAAKILVDSLSRDFTVTQSVAPSRAPMPMILPGVEDDEAPPWLDDEPPLPPDDEPLIAPPAPLNGNGVKRNGNRNGNGNGNGKVSAVREDKPAYDSAIGPVPPRPPVTLAAPEIKSDAPPRRLIITLRSSGDPDRDTRRLRRVHGLLVSYPGADQFVFNIHEHDAREYQLRFPNHTTGYCPPLERQLRELLGPDAVEVRDE